MERTAFPSRGKKEENDFNLDGSITIICKKSVLPLQIIWGSSRELTTAAPLACMARSSTVVVYLRVRELVREDWGLG